MLIDEFNPKAWKEHLPAYARHVMASRHQFMRYKISDEVVREVGTMLREHPDLFMNNYQFALSPYPKMYIEYNLDVMIKALDPDFDLEAIEQRDTILGVIIDDNKVFTLVEARHKPIAKNITLPAILPIYYTINYDHCMGNDVFLFPLHETTKRTLFFGSLANKIVFTNEQYDEFMRRFNVWCNDFIRKRMDRETFDNAIRASAGELKNLLAILLWINQPKLLDFQSVPATRRWYGSKNIAYAAHNIVRLKKHVTYKNIYREMIDRQGPRRHEVSAFFRNFSKTACEHEWPIMPDEDGRWHCLKCSQWRIRVKNHMRGDASRGFVTKEYKV